MSRTIIRFEQTDGVPPKPLVDLAGGQKALEAAGIEFIGTPEDGPGIRVRKAQSPGG